MEYNEVKSCFHLVSVHQSLTKASGFKNLTVHSTEIDSLLLLSRLHPVSFLCHLPRFAATFKHRSSSEKMQNLFVKNPCAVVLFLM